MKCYAGSEDGVSVLEYVLLVALVALVATGSLLYLGRASQSPSHVANNVGNNVAFTGNAGAANPANLAAGGAALPAAGSAANLAAGGAANVAGGGANAGATDTANAGGANAANVAAGGAANALAGRTTGTPVKAWCTSGESGCSDPMLMNGQPEIIHFWATGGSGHYSYQLQGSVPPFMIPDWSQHEITVEPTDCSHDPGTYTVSLVVSDSAGDTGRLNFILNVAPGSLC